MPTAPAHPTAAAVHTPMPDLHTVTLADGPGIPVVFAHALGLDHRMWDAMAHRWHGRRPVLAYDQRGHGASPVSSAAYGMDALVADAAALIGAWGRGPVIFVGLSLGGMVAQGLALQRPETVRGLVLAHTVARYDEAARRAWRARSDTVSREGMAAVVDTVLSRYLTAGVRAAQPAVVAAMRATLLRNEARSYAAACDAIAGVDWLDALPAVDTPTLLIAGDHDVGAPPAAMRSMQARIPGSQLVVLPEASHLGPVEQPDAFWTLIDAFVGQLEAGAERPGLAA